MADDLNQSPAPKGDEGKTFTQADVDRIIDQRLARDKAKYADYDELKAKAGKLDEQEAAGKSELDKANGRIAQLEKDLTAANARADRYEVALDKGLDMTRAKRLAGATREELEADAEELKGWSPGKSDTPPPSKPAEDLKGGGDPTTEPAVDIRKMVAEIPRGGF